MHAFVTGWASPVGQCRVVQCWRGDGQCRSRLRATWAANEAAACCVARPRSPSHAIARRGAAALRSTPLRRFRTEGACGTQMLLTRIAVFIAS